MDEQIAKLSSLLVFCIQIKRPQGTAIPLISRVTRCRDARSCVYTYRCSARWGYLTCGVEDLLHTVPLGASMRI